MRPAVSALVGSVVCVLAGCAPGAIAPRPQLLSRAAPVSMTAIAAPAALPVPKQAMKPKTTAPATLVGKDALLDEILHGIDDPLAKQVVAAPEAYRFQVLFSVVKDGKLERRGWRADAEYFFPASAMKVPIALAAYERMNALRKAGKKGFTRDAMLKIYPTKGSGAPYATTLARETWRALIISDNDSANRLLAVTGHREVHESCFALGLSSTRVRTGFATNDDADAAITSPRIVVADTIDLAPRKSTLVLPPTDAKSLDIGTAYIGDNGRRVEGPMPFKDKNAMKLRHMQDALIRIMRPELLPPPPPGSIYQPTETPADDVAYLRETLGTLPSDSGLAGYDRNILADYPLSPFLRGIERVRERGKFQIFQKVGQAYGFLIHNAYIVDKESGRAFFLAAAIYANDDGVLNDDIYGYDQVAYPVLADVGEAFTREAFEVE